jgi:hypothetical protein
MKAYLLNPIKVIYDILKDVLGRIATKNSNGIIEQAVSQFKEVLTDTIFATSHTTSEITFKPLKDLMSQKLKLIIETEKELLLD